MLGRNTFIPGFEEQLSASPPARGATVEATFPEAYAARKLAGKQGEFDVTVKAVAAPEPLAIDDEFAKSYGVESLDAAQDAMRERIDADYARASRDKLKRELLDALDERYSFELPQGLVEQEFDSIWAQVEREQQAPAADFRRRGQDRGGGARRISLDRRAPRAPRPGAGRDRRQGGVRSATRR